MKQSLSILLVFLFLLAVATLGKGCYDDTIRTETVSDLKTKTQKNEGEAIEKVIQIDRDISQLSDDDIDARLLEYGDYWTADSSDSEQSERVPSIRNAQVIKTGSSEVEAPSGAAQRPIPITLPRPCEIVYGFDKDQKIIEIEVCK